MARKRTTLYAAFSNLGVPAINVFHFNAKKCALLIGDRIANGEALPGEHMQRVTVAFYRKQYTDRGWHLPAASLEDLA